MAVSSLTGEVQWRWMSFPKPRPLYGLDKLAENPNALVMLVEGEKAADAAQELFIANGLPMQDLVVVTWPGGGKAVKHVDWSPLAGRAVALWPDADFKRYPANHERSGVPLPFLEQPGTVAMLEIWRAIRETAARVQFILPPANVPDGWDLADPAPPGFDLLRHIKHHKMHADAVERRFSLAPSISADDKIVPIWFVPALSPAELRRAAFAAEVVAFSMPDLGGRIDPRGVQLRPFAGIDGLRAARGAPAPAGGASARAAAGGTGRRGVRGRRGRGRVGRGSECGRVLGRQRVARCWPAGAGGGGGGR